MKVSSDDIQISMARRSRDELLAIVSSSDGAYTVEARSAAATELENRPAEEEVTPAVPMTAARGAGLAAKIISFIVLMGALRSVLRLLQHWFFK